MRSDKCESCFYVKVMTAKDTGQINAGGQSLLMCRRYPPVVMAVMQQGTTAGFQAMHPPVQADHTCGEYRSAVTF